ncbi:MAG TPA: TMEM43 family protein [Xanthomonadaceae bacterium]|nr:TMEM43 family protein [Xanthomonadaceae bacterium]
MGRRARRVKYRRPLPLLLAVFLVVVMLVLVFQWREQRRVTAPVALPTPVVVAAAPVDRAREGRAVQVSGRTSSPRPVLDPVFGISIDGIALVRRVEMRQWQERIDSTGAAVYVQVWSEDAIDSSVFMEAESHANPLKMPFESVRVAADSVRLGDFLLGPAVLSRLSGTEEPAPAHAESLPENLAASFAARDGELHTASDPDAPDIGDLRIRFFRVPHQTITVVARQVGNRLEPVPLADGGEHLEVRRGPSR